MKSFIEKCVDGEESLDNVDDYVDEWHNGLSILILWEYLGMTVKEYVQWVKEPEYINEIVKTRKLEI